MTNPNYERYLQSEHWKQLRAKKRRRVAKRAGGKVRCGICGSTEKIQTHHLCYKRLYDVQTSDLRMLCERCHKKAHELLGSGEIKLKRGASHHSLFVVTKEAVKKALGLKGKNLFN